MTIFFSLVKYVGIAILVFMAVVLVVAIVIGVVVAVQPTFPPGLFRS